MPSTEAAQPENQSSPEQPPRGLTITVKELHERFAKLMQQYPDDDACIEGIVLSGAFDLNNCYECGCTELTRDYGSWLVTCKMCRYTKDLFDGTFFHKMRRPMAYFVALWLRNEQIGISSNRLGRLVGVAQSTAYEILKKLDTVVFEMMMSECPDINSGVFRQIFTKRSSETPARKSPETEQDALDEMQREQHNAQQHNNNEESAAKADHEFSSDHAAKTDESDLSFAEDFLKVVFDAITEKPISDDELCDLTGLPTGKVLAALTTLTSLEKIRTAGLNQYVRLSKDIPGLSDFFKVDKEKLDRFFDQIRHVHHGISRKNLQKYLAWYWSFVNKSFANSSSLLSACARFRHITRHELRHFVTAPTVKMLPV